LSLGPANHSFIGTITINAGEVKVAGGFVDAERSVALANSPGAMLTVDGQDQIIGGLSGGGTAGGEVRINGSLTVGGDNSDRIYAGVITGNGSFSKRGTGSLALSNPNSTYSGLTYIDEGILNINHLADDGVPSALGLSGLIKVGNSATLRYTGAMAASTDRRLELVGAAKIEVPSSDAAVTLSGRVSGDSLQKTGSGSLILSGTNTYTGSTTVSAGTLKVSGGNAIPDSSPVNLVGDRSLSAAAMKQLIASAVLAMWNWVRALYAYSVRLIRVSRVSFPAPAD
jgi:autotransporter-associated beta strand protein